MQTNSDAIGEFYRQISTGPFVNQLTKSTGTTQILLVRKTRTTGPGPILTPAFTVANNNLSIDYLKKDNTKIFFLIPSLFCSDQEGQPEVTDTDCPQNAPVQETSSGQVMIDPSEFIASSGKVKI